MPETWASSGVDLHLDRAGPRLRASLEDQLREAVRSGRLAPGLRLPSSRSLAADLGVARNTVVDVYGQLVAEGWLVARQGSVTRIAGRTPAAEAAPATGGVPRRLRYDLRPGSPDVAAFPRSRWLAAARRALNTAPAAAFGDAPDARGRPELHQALAGYLARARGVRVSPDRIVICSGFTQGLGLICQVLRARGATTLAMEEYGLPDLRGIAAGHGLRSLAAPGGPGRRRPRPGRARRRGGAGWRGRYPAHPGPPVPAGRRARARPAHPRHRMGRADWRVPHRG